MIWSYIIILRGTFRYAARTDFSMFPYLRFLHFYHSMWISNRFSTLVMPQKIFTQHNWNYKAYSSIANTFIRICSHSTRKQLRIELILFPLYKNSQSKYVTLFPDNLNRTCPCTYLSLCFSWCCFQQSFTLSLDRQLILFQISWTH